MCLKWNFSKAAAVWFIDPKAPTIDPWTHRLLSFCQGVTSPMIGCDSGKISEDSSTQGPQTSTQRPPTQKQTNPNRPTGQRRGKRSKKHLMNLSRCRCTRVGRWIDNRRSKKISQIKKSGQFLPENVNFVFMTVVTYQQGVLCP